MARIHAWFHQEVIDRAPVRFHHHNIEYENSRVIKKGPWTTCAERWLDVDFQVRAFEASLEGTQFLGETFPVFWPNLSAVVYNLFLGQEAEFDDMTAWTHPCIDDLGNLPDLKIQRENLYFRTIEALTQRALERAGDRYLVGFTDMYAGVDCTAGLRGTEQMCLDLVLDPEGLHRLIDRAFAEYPDVYAHFDRILKAHDQLSVNWMNLPSYDTFNVLACDFAVNISKDHFNEFCMPVLRREAELFTHNVFHMDGPGVAKNLDSILTLPNLKAVQWVQGYGVDKPVMQWLPLIEKVQTAGLSIIVDLELDELESFMKRVDPKGVMLWIPAKPEDQANVLEKVKRW